MSEARIFVKRLYDAAVAAAHPATCLPALLPQPPRGHLILIAGGKAAGSMTQAAEEFYLDTLKLPAGRLKGIAVTRHGYGRPTRVVEMLEAGHPVPDTAGLKAAEQALALAESATDNDLVVVLISGGASANWIAPAHGVSFEDKRAVTRALLRSGANIGEINTVRKHLSRIKGGRLAKRAYPAPVVTIAISDVPGDDPAVIGSGPTVPDRSTLAEARAIIEKYKLALPSSVLTALKQAENETPKPGDHEFANTSFTLAARPADALRAAQEKARAAGYDCLILGDSIEGEASEVAQTQASIARRLRDEGKQIVILSGGELTVTIAGKGQGGPNQEYALSFAMAIDGLDGITALAADTDGTDGGAGFASDPAGAIVDWKTIARAEKLGLDPAAFLANNDSTAFFARLGDLVIPGPTYTNVNDFRAIVVDRG